MLWQQQDFLTIFLITFVSSTQHSAGWVYAEAVIVQLVARHLVKSNCAVVAYVFVMSHLQVHMRFFLYPPKYYFWKKKDHTWSILYSFSILSHLSHKDCTSNWQKQKELQDCTSRIGLEEEENSSSERWVKQKQK